MKTKICPRCNLEKPHSEFHSSKNRPVSSYCKKCLYEVQKRRWRERKFKAITLFDGKCQKCGYNKCYNALEFHHIDQYDKEFDWNRLKGLKWKSVIEELKKCMLVCSNCHREIHAKNEDYTLSGKDNASLVKESLSATGICPNCKEPTYGTKFCSSECVHFSKRKVKRPTREELDKILKLKSYCEIGRQFGVSDVAVKKWAKFYGLVD